MPTVTPLAVNLDNAIATQRFTAWLLVAFSAVAMTLAAVGIYGVISYSVAQRTSEMGIRLALGAAPGRVARMVLLDGCTPASIGVVLGSARGGRAVSAHDDVTFRNVADRCRHLRRRRRRADDRGRARELRAGAACRARRSARGTPSGLTPT